MRIKRFSFRAWDSNTKTMVYPDGKNYGFKIIDSQSDVMMWFEDEYIMQSTGLNDKNEKEIYEGDIVKRTLDVGFPTERCKNWVIKWGSWCYMRYSDENNGFGFDAIDARTNCEVIGNIYENPELLNV